MKTIHALLVGINHYHKDSGVASLKGCEHDTLKMEDFLRQHFDRSYNLNIARLLNEQSTYDNIVRHFGESHLLKAKKHDTILFYYSGHGAREKAAEEFSEFFPDGYNESIVCYDSRIENGKDLADKELAVLINRLANTGAHLVVIMDCCHSGGGTKEIGDFELGATRQTYDRKVPRPYESYLNGYFADKYPGGLGIDIPRSQHILLAACRNKEKAYELKSNKGFFTTFLLKALESGGAALSYADLYTNTRSAMRRLSDGQHPQFETSGHFDAFGSFLTGINSESSKNYLVNLVDEKWTINCGAVHGLPTEPDKKSAFALYKNGKLKGHASAKMVGFQESELRLDFTPDAKNYDATLISLPAPGIPVALDIDKAGKRRLENALKKQHPLHIELTEERGTSPFLLKVRARQVQVINAKTSARLRTILGGDNFKIFDDGFRFLDHLARWEKTLLLQNQRTRIDVKDVEIILEEFETTGGVYHHIKDHIVLDALKSTTGFKPVQIGLKVRNNHHRILHCSLFYFSQEYGISFLDYREIPAFETATFIKKDTLNVPLGLTEATDIFKLFVSTEKIDDFLIEQESVKLGQTETFEISKGINMTDEDLEGARALGSQIQEDEDSGSDWFTKTMIVKTVGRESRVGNQPVEMADGMIKVMPHATFKAELSMTVANTGSKDIEEVAIIPKLMRLEGMEMLSFGDTTRNIYGTPNVLELTEIEDDGSLAENPLEILINTHLNTDEELLPVTFDGEHILPIGEATRQPDGSTKVEIRYVPDTQAVTRKSLTKALKMVFMKVVLRKNDMQKLCWIDYSGEKAERVEKDVKEKVAAAQNILMVIHGIIGDTQGQSDCMRQAFEDGTFDLILSFDYENLNTPIEQTAQKLKSKLIEAGIEENTDKNLWILAHSMGGLVSRYFIEMLNGKTMVKHLIMAGTPNGGSAIGDITTHRDTAVTLMGFLLNSFASLPMLPYLALLTSVLKGSKELTYTLGQMKEKNSPFIEALENSAPPDIPYSIVAGHLFEFIEKEKEAKSLVDKLFKMGGKLFYKDRPNDLAVSVDSIKHVLHNSIHPDRMRDLPGHHLNYFTLEESVEILYELIEPETLNP